MKFPPGRNVLNSSKYTGTYQNCIILKQKCISDFVVLASCTILPAAAVILRDVNCDFSNYLWKSWNFRSNIPNMSKLSDRCHWKYWSAGANRRLVQSLSILYLNFQIVFGYLKIIFQIIITKCIFLLIYHIDIVNRNLHIFSNFLVTKQGYLVTKQGLRV